MKFIILYNKVAQDCDLRLKCGLKLRGSVSFSTFNPHFLQVRLTIEVLRKEVFEIIFHEHPFEQGRILRAYQT